MLKGVHLTLLVGPVVPVPVPQVVLDALTQIEVVSPDEAAGAFTLQFTLSVQSPLHTLFLLSGGGVVPLLRVIVVVTVNGAPQVLIDGVVTKTDVTPGADQRHTQLQVSGDDLTTVMQKLEFSGLPGLPYPAMPNEAIVALILAKYAFLGVVPLVIPSIAIDVPIPTDHIPTQQGTDLDYIRTLAERVGYVFYIEPGPVPGVSTAYWGPKIKVGVPQPALNATWMRPATLKASASVTTAMRAACPLSISRTSKPRFRCRCRSPISVRSIRRWACSIHRRRSFARCPRRPNIPPFARCCWAWPKRRNPPIRSRAGAASM